MDGDDSDGVGGANEPGTHITESVNNGEKLFVMDFIINFSRGEFVRVKSNRMEKVVVVGLKKDGSKGKVGSISNNCGRESRIECWRRGAVVKESLRVSKDLMAGGKVCEGMFGSFCCKSMERKVL